MYRAVAHRTTLGIGGVAGRQVDLLRRRRLWSNSASVDDERVRKFPPIATFYLSAHPGANDGAALAVASARSYN